MGQITSSFMFNRIPEAITLCPDLKLLWLTDFCQIGKVKGGRVRKVRINDANYVKITDRARTSLKYKKEKVKRQGKELGDLVKRTIHDNFKCFSSSNIRNFIFTCVMAVIVLYFYRTKG